MRTMIITILACLFATGCGPAESPEPGRGKEFMKHRECEKCGKIKIDLFGGER